MIVLEGPDGGGKSTLLTHLQKTFPHIATHARFSSSVGGPIDALDTAVASDMQRWANRQMAPQFYDRHPFISEFIYGPIIRGEIKDGLGRIELMTHRARFYRDALVILCLPDAFTIETNLNNDMDNQMDGVLSHIGEIYNAYHKLHRDYNGNLVWYDYNAHTTEYIDKMVDSYFMDWMKQ